MKTYYTGITTIEEAYETIEDFFSTFHLHEALEQLDDLITWACREGYYKKQSPACMMFFVEKLEGLCQAAEIMAYSTGRNPDAIIYSPDMDGVVHDPFEFVRDMENGWRDFPRSLSGEEFLNPYRVCELFGMMAYQKTWQIMLKELLESALGNGTIDGNLKIDSLVIFNRMLCKVLEGLYLLNFQTNE